MKILAITGVSGTLGYHLLRETLKTTDFRIRALVRSSSRIDWTGISAEDRARVDLIVGDLLNTADVAKYLEGADAVIHAAANTDVSAGLAELESANVAATKNLYDRAAEQRVRRFIHISSASIYKKNGKPVFEDSPQSPRLPYEKTKAAAEKILLEKAGAGPETVILRPTIIYGEAARHIFGRLMAWVPMLNALIGSVPTFEGGPVTSWVHALDVARAALFVLNEDRARNQIFNVAAPEPVQIGEMVSEVSKAFGFKQGRSFKINARRNRMASSLVPFSIWMMVSFLLERYWSHLCERGGAVAAIRPAIDADLFSYWDRDWVVDTSRLTSLGFKYVYPDPSLGIREASKWYIDQKWVPRTVAADTTSGIETGFQFDEVMTGHLEIDGHKSNLEFAITSFAPDLRRFLVDGKMKSFGQMRIENLAAEVACSGDLDMPVRSRWVHIRLEFNDDMGRPLIYVASKKLTVFHLVRDITTFIGRVETQDGKVLGKSIARFDLRQNTGMLLRSIRFFGVRNRLERSSSLA